ncbi:MAG: hypothetical protein ABSF22_00805 [Bryobacteraceae bacterium]
MTGTPEFQQRLESMESLIREIEATGDPNVRTAARELMQLVMELHGNGLERILEIVRAESNLSTLEGMCRDELVSSLLVLYNIHPLSLETRVHQAIETANRKMRSRDATVELLGIDDGAVRLNLKANGHGPALKEVVEAAIYQTAPDITSLVIDGAEEKQAFLPLEMLLATRTAT